MEFRSEKTRRLWCATLDTYAKPAIGNMLVGSLTASDIRRMLHPIWATKTDTASRLRGRIENVLAWATMAGHRQGDNPARWRGNLDTLLPKPGKPSAPSARQWREVARHDRQKADPGRARQRKRGREKS